MEVHGDTGHQRLLNPCLTASLKRRGSQIYKLKRPKPGAEWDVFAFRRLVTATWMVRLASHVTPVAESVVHTIAGI